jgi:hypothetical protein
MPVFLKSLQVRVAGVCFDFDLSWKMFNLACEYAQGLKLHDLDGENELGDEGNIRSDDHRRGFWQLIQYDVYFRLVFDKPLTITSKSWKVNLPFVGTDAQPLQDEVQFLLFLVNSRLTMVCTNFFALLEDKSLSPLQLKRQTEDLCRQVRSIFAEWKVVC